GNQRGIVLLAGGIGLVEGRLAAACLVHAHRGVGETLAIGGLVVEEGDLLAVVIVEQELAGDVALLVVTAADAVDARAGALLGEVRIGRSGRDLDDALVGID